MSSSSAARLSLLREALHALDLHAFLVPLTDAFQSEYPPASSRRIEWLTGFTGSAGTAVVTREEAAFFTDGRYTLQARDEVDAACFALHNGADLSPEQWLATRMDGASRIGIDPWLHTVAGVRRMTSLMAGEIIPVTPNPIDTLWTDRPAEPCAPAVRHPETFAGESAASKRARIADGLRAAGLDAFLLSAPESVAWLLNLRGGDVPNTPLMLGYAVLHADASVTLYADPRKVRGLTIDGVRMVALDAMPEDLRGLSGKRVGVDPLIAPYAFVPALAGADVVEMPDPCQLPRACKNVVEIEGMRTAHRRDGAALTAFLCWLDGHWQGLDEIAAAEMLASFRQGGDHYRGPSFPTIAGAGPNGAIVHYRAVPESARKLEAGSLFLLDSGGQYLDGTTDVTRTVAIGSPSAEMRDRFTRVLKGHIALATVRFPKGTTGSQLDVLARRALWDAGLDYDHGTGHGVGSYLGVHEGPQRISKRGGDTPLAPGMILSNEPGYYKTGEYGIRIENLVTVVEDGAAERPFLRFETLTLAPIDLRLVDEALLTTEETAWLHGYHARVREALLPSLDEKTGEWLKKSTSEPK